MVHDHIYELIKLGTALWFMKALKVIFTSKAIVLYDEPSFISVHMYTCTLKFTVLNVSHYVVLTLDHMGQTSTLTLYKPHL